MNKIIASVGLVALGAANVQAQSQAPSQITAPGAKWWNVQATVRGFYDDNINSTPDAKDQTGPTPIAKVHAYGFQLSPKVGVVWGNDQTSITADYEYSFLYYDHRPLGNTERYDQDHTFNLMLNHTFNERYAIHAHETFVIGQEPDALRSDAAFHTPFRVSGDNKVNVAGITFDAELTPLLGLELGYDNAWFDYADKFGNPKNVGTDGNVIPSNSGVLDRVEQTPHLALQWHALPDTTASLGYRFTQINYTANEPISGPPGAPLAKSDIRDNRGHTVYVGLDHQFRPDFYGSLEGGISYYDYYNLNETAWGPYGRLSLTYVYMQDSSLQLGFQEGRAATDVLGPADTRADVVRDAETSVVFATVRQRIVPNLFANLTGSFQNQNFKGGGPDFDGKTERFYVFGANLEYQFNPHISAHVGYDFDKLDSDIADRSYTRNKVYIGATASY
ncbi:MAG TPA: outer membrane beta-barrel protein [Verrucomicrobiae bacterium]|nr:outer membrane beta-barrel protein [Verrucomicrobiae bacterium]